MTKFVFKRGDTFDLSGPVTMTSSGSAVSDMTGWTARSQVRRFPSGELLAELDLTWLQFAPPIIRLRAQDTVHWVPGRVQIDVEFVAPDESVISTDTQQFEVVEDVTR